MTFSLQPSVVHCSSVGFQGCPWLDVTVWSTDPLGNMDHVWSNTIGDVVLDVGAAFGSYAVTALACGAAHVYAWSPDEGDNSLTMFAETLALNGWTDRCTLINGGMYSRDGWINPLRQSFVDRIDEPGLDSTGFIKVSTLDTWFATAPRHPAGTQFWLKMDVEGAEPEVLRGARTTVATLKPKMLIENHNFKRATLEQEVRDLLTTEFGYKEVCTTPYHSVSHSLYVPA